MKKIKTSKKVLALLLSLSLIFTMMPATAWNAFAAETDTDYLFFATDRHANTSVIGNIINNMESVIGENELDYLGLGGDMVGSGNSHPAYNSSTVLGEVTGATSSLSATNVDIVAGIHDMNVTDDAGIVLPYKGGGAQIYEGDKYYVYGVEEYCISEDSNESNWSSEASKFVTWANGTDIDKSKVIFVLSHYPLHANRNDNDGAYYWHQALNTVATGSATGETVTRDIVFFHGHNHTVDSNEYVYNVGDTMSVQNGSSTASETIRYTYATAGYLNQNKKATLVTLTDDAITLNKYTTSGSGETKATVTRVVQEETKTLTSIEVAGTTEYTVGGNGLDLTVTAKYDDGTTADVTKDATFDPAELTASGTYTVTASYGGMTDTIDVKVDLYDEVLADDGENLLISVGAFSQGATALDVTWDDEAETILDDAELYTDYVVYDLALTNPGETTEFSMSLVDNMDTTNLVVYHVAEDGTLTLIPHEIKNDCVVFTTSLTGAFAYGSVTVPEGYTLSSITMENTPTDLFVGDSLDLTEAVITATYTKEDAEDFIRQLTVYDYDVDNFSGYDVNKAGAYTAVFTYDGVTAEFPINVWDDEFTVDDVTVHVGEGEYGVKEAVVEGSTNDNVATAIQNVINGDNYVAYDITLEYAEGYEANEADKTVTLPIPEGVSNPVVYYVSDSGKAVDMKAVNNGDGTVTFTTTHFSTYVVGDGIEITVPDNETATGTDSITTTSEKDAYVLVSTPTAGNQYIIVSSGSAGTGYALKENTTTGTSVTINAATGNIAAPYIETSDETIMWNATSGLNFKSENGGYYLNYSSSSSGGSQKPGSGSSSSYSLSFSTSSASDWTAGTNQLYRNGQQNDYYLRYNSGWTMGSSNSTYNVYFYEKQTVKTETTTTVSGTFSIAGEDMTVPAVQNATIDLSSILTFTPTSGTATNEDVSKTATYEVYDTDTTDSVKTGDPLGVISSIEGNVVKLSGNTGKAIVKVSYETDFGTVTDYITVEATVPDHYSIQLHKASMTEATGVTADNVTNYYIFNTTTGVYEKATSYVEGTTYYTTPVIQGEEITDTIALKGIEAGDTYSVWAVVKAYASADDAEGVDLGALGNALSWSVSDPSIATIDTETGVITFTGQNYGTFTVTVAYEGADGKPVTDTITISVTESLYVVPGDGTNDFPEYPNEGAVRFDKNATAVGNFSETGIAQVELSMTGVPYSTGSEIDVVIMLDMTGSMSDTAMAAAEESAIAFAEQIVKNEDGTFNNNRIAILAFNSGSDSPYTYWELATVTSEQWDGLCTAVRGASDDQESGGTPYDEALEKCQSVLTEAKTTNLPEGVESAADYNRQQFCVFVSDGGPTSYQYITNYDEVKAGTATAYTTSSASATGGSNQSDSNFATIATYTHEYYSTLMKDDGVTMYSILTGLSAEDYPNCTTILQNIASDSSKAYVVEDGSDTSAVSGALTNIATQIREAAKDVKVEDKIGNNYSMNFSVPGYGTDNAVSEDALDGLTEFYIQVVEYQLNADKERTGDPAVLENFTFNADGTLKSHTVDGVACSGCAHVTTTDGVITTIDGTYFDYKSDSTGEYLNWEADKLTTTELALQYFAYLENSSGVAEADQVDAGTYYTNEYATLTYTNYNGNEVQQEFPVPQMTWYGAQVSYVFYLVNEEGQPVNRAGRVVPFAEAVYVTDINTYSIVWNDLEQSAGLEAERLANNLVPEVYELYDEDASYNIHVYANEEGVNLNNHFIIGGDMDNDTWENANAETTYVFNAKADATKYNTVGAYIANDGFDEIDSNSYYCKSAYITDAKYTTSVDAAGVTSYTVTELGNGYQKVDGETQVLASALESTTGGTVIDGYVYYVDENGVYTIVEKTDGTEVREGFDFANTTVAFAVVWKPELVEDTVVVDYGLDVVIDVASNDALASGVVGVRADAPSVAINSGTYDATKEIEANVAIGGTKIATAKVENLNSVRFSLDKENSMKAFNAPVKFYYESDVNYYKDSELQTTSMYSSVTVIPATTVYYEDDFVTFTNSSKACDVTEGDATISYGKWTVDGTTLNKTQDQDRPGTSKISEELDADNVYGHDSAYANMSTYSMGSAHKVKVANGISGMASFDFYGTGFDVISMTDSTTGLIVVNVYDESGLVKSLTVDTYYGYAREYYKIVYTFSKENGWLSEKIKVDALETSQTAPEKPAEGDQYIVYTTEWKTVDSNDPNAIYQVPVMKVEGLEYGKYTAKIVASYKSTFDHTLAGSYDFYLDAIRIYDPCGDNVDANEAYIEDGEAYPEYSEVREKLIDAKTFDSLGKEDSINGMVFIDGTGANGAGNTVSVADYASYGPNNEVYLQAGQAIAFELNATANPGTVAKVQLGIKTVGNESAVEVYGIDESGNTTPCISDTISTATDMYYDITALNGKTVVIKNAGTGDADAIVSITNVKTTYTAAQPKPIETPQVAMFMVSRASVANAIATMTVEEDDSTEETPVVPDSPTVPDTPATPEEPETPVVPDTPVTPEEPETDKPGADEQEKPVVTPAKIISVKTDKNVYTQGDKVKVTVTTNKAATKVKVGTKVLKTFNTKNGNRTWTTTVNASKLGKLTINAVAYNKNGAATKKVTKTITVKKYAPKIFKVSLNKTKVKVGAKYTVTVKAGSTVKHVRVNGKKITKFTTKNGVKTFKVTLKATKVGKQKVKVVAYNKALYPTNPKFKTVTVKRK